MKPEKAVIVPAARKILIALLAIAAFWSVADASEHPASNIMDRINKILDQTPLIDGHNDLPWEIRARFGGDFDMIDLRTNTALLPVPESEYHLLPLMTDIPRLRKGHVGGQFWSVWIPTDITGPAAVELTLKQIDLVKRMAARYPKTFEMAYTADDIVRIHQSGKIASLIGIEGGHQINNSMAVLRQMYALGARYMTLTHTRNNDWADSATAPPVHHGLTSFGRKIVGEMNRLGMLVDLSHVSDETMKAALDISKAPVIFSHSSAKALDDSPRNVPDSILRIVAMNRGIVMVNFYPGYISRAWADWSGNHEKNQPEPQVTIGMVADHIEHIRKIAGIDCVGIGSDFDGVDAVPEGLNGVDKYPQLLAELVRRGWSDQELAKLAGENLLRVLRAAEQTARVLQAETRPSITTIETTDTNYKKQAMQ